MPTKDHVSFPPLHDQVGGYPVSPHAVAMAMMGLSLAEIDRVQTSETRFYLRG